METNNFDYIAPNVIRPLIAKWAIDSWEKVHADTVYNSWRHEPFSYFPGEPTRAVVFQDDDFDFSDESDAGDSESEDGSQDRDSTQDDGKPAAQNQSEGSNESNSEDIYWPPPNGTQNKVSI
jgi:hypothetical protein